MPSPPAHAAAGRIMTGLGVFSSCCGSVALVAILFLLPSCRSSSGAVSPTGPAETDARVDRPGAPGTDVRVVQPGAPGTSSRVLSRGALDAETRPRHTEADAAFIRGMIPHHAQALEMTALVPERTANADFLRLARRIEIGQRDEILLMERWLEDRGERPPGAHAHHGDSMRMPGMLSDEEMAELRNATGSEFEMLFLRFMISHHEGALVMVRDLFSSHGAAQDSEIFRFASELDADQRMEIDRMRGMLEQGR